MYKVMLYNRKCEITIMLVINEVFKALMFLMFNYTKSLNKEILNT